MDDEDDDDNIHIDEANNQEDSDNMDDLLSLPLHLGNTDLKYIELECKSRSYLKMIKKIL